MVIFYHPFFSDLWLTSQPGVGLSQFRTNSRPLRLRPGLGPEQGDRFIVRNPELILN